MRPNQAAGRRLDDDASMLDAAVNAYDASVSILKPLLTRRCPAGSAPTAAQSGVYEANCRACGHASIACRTTAGASGLLQSNTNHPQANAQAYNFQSDPASMRRAIGLGIAGVARLYLCAPSPARASVQKGITMTRKFVDCREFPSEMNCSLALSADSEAELLEAAVHHAVSVHKHTDTPELRAQIKTCMHEGTPPVAAPARAA